MIDTKELRRQVEHEIACGAKAKNMDLPVLLSLLDRLEKAEAMLNYERRPNSDQEWARLDGAVAYHLIDRYADDWADIGNMMEAWAKARAAQENN